MKFKEIVFGESYSPISGITINKNVDINGVHQKAYSMLQGYSVRRVSDDMHMKQFKIYTHAVKNSQLSTSTKTRFIVTTKVIHLGNEDDFFLWDDLEDNLYISYNLLLVVPEVND